ncbi:MAG: tRNA (adenosine(37)-N6)-threonylcarbamoyltransferase complex dimerization subunit type 1 TsaB [Caulobacterales bacterium]
MVLALDTCLAACQAAVADGGRVLASRSEPMQRGHQERLATMVREVMAEAGVGFSEIDRIAVTTGPGSFTGLRVGLAFAKGLRLALDAPIVGIGVLEALAASAGSSGPVAAAIDARRGQVYLQLFQSGEALCPPDVLPLEDSGALIRLLAPRDATLVGPGARLLGAAGARVVDAEVPDIAAIAALGAAGEPTSELRPLYLRAPDAKPSAT